MDPLEHCLLSWTPGRSLKVTGMTAKEPACLERLNWGRFLWPSATDCAATISSAQLGYLLSDRLAQSAGNLAPDFGGMMVLL